MNRFFYFVSLACFLCFQVKAQDTIFNEEHLLKHIKTLSSDAFEGRATGTKGALKAEKYITNQLYSLNVSPFGKDYRQNFSFSDKGRNYEATNIIGLIKGTLYTDTYIVVSAHYDHLGIKNGTIYNGADDDASGISALFSFAEYLKNNPPKHSVILIAFDGEELGLRGSKYFVNNSPIPLKQIRANLNMDMISRSDKNELFAVGTYYNKTLKSIVLNNHFSDSLKLLTGHDGFDGLEDWTYASDHGNFHRKNIPFLYFGVEDHKDYHEPTDDFENIHPKFYIEAVKVIIKVFQKIDQLQL